MSGSSGIDYRLQLEWGFGNIASTECALPAGAEARLLTRAFAARLKSCPVTKPSRLAIFSAYAVSDCDGHERMVLSMSRVAPTQAATAKREPGEAVSMGWRLSQSTSSM